MNKALAVLTASLLGATSALAQPAAPTPEARAAATEAQMTPAERVILTHGIMALPIRDTVIPAMDDVRDVADRLEKLVADDLWPLPKYSEMLFIK